MRGCCMLWVVFTGVKPCGMKKKIKAGKELLGEVGKLIRGVWVFKPAWRDV